MPPSAAINAVQRELLVQAFFEQRQPNWKEKPGTIDALQF
jgi:hypothetical protein